MEAARIGIKVKCVKNDGADDHYGFAEELRWHIGDELIVTDIHIAPYGTFLCNYKGQNINIKRCEFVDANIDENLESVRLLSIDIKEARRLFSIYSNFIGDHEEKERSELWSWLKKEGREYEFEAIAECIEDYAGDQKSRLNAGDAMDEIMKEFEQSRNKVV
jgi:hypothetical protein